jgi:acetolactate synthase-1/2/3 large subunit
MKNGMPNFANLAKAYNIDGYRIDDFEQLQSIVNNTLQKYKPALLDINVIEKENCYPMVAPGRSNSQMLGLDTEIIISST